MDGPSTSVSLLQNVRDPNNNEAWRQFVALYGPIVYRLAKKKGLDRDMADQITQDFFIRMTEVMPRFQYQPGRGRFRSWVMTVALNEIRRHWRESDARGRALEAYEKQQLQGEADEDDVRHWWQSAEATSLLHLALDQLKKDVPAEHYEIFGALVIRRESGEDVAARFKKNRNQVYSIKFRLLAKLRAIAAQMGESWDEP